MLKTERERKICKKYSQRDENGLVRCDECPLLLRHTGFRGWGMMCKAAASYNRKAEEWEYDVPTETVKFNVDLKKLAMSVRKNGK